MSKLEAVDTRLANYQVVMAEKNTKLCETEDQITTLKYTVHTQESTIRTITKAVRELHERSVDSENRSRRNNLVFYGADNSESETWEQSEELIKNIFKDNLGLELQAAQKAHRIGRYNKTKKMPIIVNFASYKEKSNVLSNARNFKELHSVLTKIMHLKQEIFVKGSGNMQRQIKRMKISGQAKL